MRKPFNLKNKAYVKIIDTKGSNRLYLYVKYPGEKPYEESTGMLNTPENREDLQAEVDDMNADIKAGVFSFEDAFPYAPSETQRRFSRLEQRALKHNTTSVTFEMGIKLWEEKAHPALPNRSIKRDHKSAVGSHIEPYFAGHRLDEITTTEIKTFFSKMERADSLEGDLSAKRMRTVLYVFESVWEFIQTEFGLKMDSPFGGINKFITKITRSKSINPKDLDAEKLKEIEKLLNKNETIKRRALDFTEYLSILEAYEDRRMRLAMELMFLTGMIPSEVGGLLPMAVSGSHIKVHLSLVRGELNYYPKNDNRIREIPITKRIREILDEAIETSPLDFIFSAPRGGFFNEKTNNYHWSKACKKAGVETLDPYSSRHSFVAYCEVMDIFKPRIIDLMGHADKSLIDKVYGKYRKAIERFKEDIKAYYGEDFWNPYD